MQSQKKSAGFSFIELVVVISILAILSTISFLSFSAYLTDARNSDRVSNIGEMKISLRAAKQRNGAYPIPGNKSTLTYSGTGVVYQGLFNQALAINTISKIPTDPKIPKKYYGYATTTSRQLFQIGLSIEDDETWHSYMDGDYNTVAKGILPSLLTSTGAGTSGLSIDIGVDANRKTFVLNGGTANLLYDTTGNPKKNTTLDFTGILNEQDVTVVETTDYSSCQEIYEAGRSLGAGTYNVVDDSGVLSGTGCTMNPLTGY